MVCKLSLIVGLVTLVFQTLAVLSPSSLEHPTNNHAGARFEEFRYDEGDTWILGGDKQAGKDATRPVRAFTDVVVAGGTDTVTRQDMLDAEEKASRKRRKCEEAHANPNKDVTDESGDDDDANDNPDKSAQDMAEEIAEATSDDDDDDDLKSFGDCWTPEVPDPNAIKHNNEEDYDDRLEEVTDALAEEKDASDVATLVALVPAGSDEQDPNSVDGVNGWVKKSTCDIYKKGEPTSCSVWTNDVGVGPFQIGYNANGNNIIYMVVTSKSGVSVSVKASVGCGPKLVQNPTAQTNSNCDQTYQLLECATKIRPSSSGKSYLVQGPYENTPGVLDLIIGEGEGGSEGGGAGGDMDDNVAEAESSGEFISNAGGSGE